jgi:hypothetical protein
VSKLVFHFILVYISSSKLSARSIYVLIAPDTSRHTGVFINICPLSGKSLSFCVTSYLVSEDVSSYLLIKLCML